MLCVARVLECLFLSYNNEEMFKCVRPQFKPHEHTLTYISGPSRPMDLYGVKPLFVKTIIPFILNEYHFIRNRCSHTFWFFFPLFPIHTPLKLANKKNSNNFWHKQSRTIIQQTHYHPSLYLSAAISGSQVEACPLSLLLNNIACSKYRYHLPRKCVTII